MADLKISQLSAAAPLTGAELVELVQSGVNVQSTTGALMTAPASGTIFGNPGSPFNLGLGSVVRWAVSTCNPIGNLIEAGTTSDGLGIQWTATPAVSSHQAPNLGASTIGAATGFPLLVSAAALNSGADLNGAGTWSTNGPQIMYRLLSPALPIAGFSLVFYGCMTALAAAATCFFGMGPSGAAFSGSQVPSAALNSIAFAKDIGDTNLQFIYNNGAGTATKTDTGMAFTSLLNHMFKLVITCDVLGNVTASFTDLEAGGLGSVSYGVASATVKLPAVNTNVQPRFYMSTGNQAVAVSWGFHSVFTASGFIA